MEYLIAIIGVLVGVVGGLGGALTSSKAKNKQLKSNNETLNETIEVNKQISDVVNAPDDKNTNIEKEEGKTGIIKHLIILISSVFLFGCTPVVTTLNPHLIKINKPNDFKNIEYKVVNGGYFLSNENMKEFIRQFDWCSNAVKKYEQQIDIVLNYNKKKED